MRDSEIGVGGGRMIAATEYGDPDGRCWFFFHGAPATRLRIRYLDEQFAERGLRVVALDRPGYGGSTPQPGRTYNDWPSDVASVAESLGVDRFFVAGHSSGGPYAVACAALLGGRVAGAVVAGGVSDWSWPGAHDDYLTGRPEREIMAMTDEAQAMRASAEHFGEDGGGFMSAPFELPKPDEQMFAEDEAFAAASAASRAEAFRQGIGGYAQDVFVEGRGWPFDASSITCPVVVIHGEHDTLLPVAHSRHTADLVHGSELRILSGHGHFTILSEIPDVAAELTKSVV